MATIPRQAFLPARACRAPLQTLGFMFTGPRFIDACRRRYGDAVTFSTLFDERFVMVFHPELIKELFQGPPEQLRAGEANVMLGPIVGERSVLLLDGPQHLRHRRLMAAPFHGRRMQAHAEAMRASTDLEIDSWPVGEPFSLLPQHAVADAAGDPARGVRIRARRRGGGAPPAAAGDARAAVETARDDAAARRCPSSAATAPP